MGNCNGRDEAAEERRMIYLGLNDICVKPFSAHVEL